MTMATVIPPKRGSGKFMAGSVTKFFGECGDQAGDIIIKTDQEAAIAYLARSIVTERGSEIGCVSSRQPFEQRHRGAGCSDRGGSNQGHEDRP